MRLVGYGLGEIVDRLSILALKRYHGEAAGVDVAHFVDESEALIAQMDPTWGISQDALALAAINGELWCAEDAVRLARARGTKQTLAHLAVTIQALNDRRSQLIEQINGTAATPEKLYAVDAKP